MTKERLEEVLQNIIDWGMEHDDEFMECLVDAMDLSNGEVKELELEEYVDDEDKPDLPDKVTLKEDVIEDFDYDDDDVDDDSLQECIDEYLSDEYGYGINDYDYKCYYNKKDELIRIELYNIDWDLSE